MPRLIHYETASSTLAAQGLIPLYHHSGTFGFTDDSNVHYAGWLGADDPTLRPAMRDLATRVAEPHPVTLATLARRLWLEHTPGPLWFTPGSHWAYELQDGGEHFMPDLLRAHHIDPTPLRDLNQGAPLEFAREESDAFHAFLTTVLQQTKFTDYGLLFPSSPLVAVVHHHVQIWWRVKDLQLLSVLRDPRSLGL